MKVEFDETLVTGNETIDSQHKELIGRIDALMESCAEGTGKLKAVKMLDYLMDYTEFHFDAEEKLQEEAEYPGIKEHKAKHDEFRQSVKELQEMLEEEEGPTDAFVKQVEKNVVDWLFAHIKGFDRSVAEYINMRQHPERL